MRAPNVLRLLVYSLTIGFGVSACNADSEIVDHAFEFDALHDSPGIQILNYQYGESKAPGARNPDYLIKEGRSAQRTAISGPMKRPNALYVKWRVLADGKVYEDTVDLRDRLPRNLNDCIVYFIVKGPQLHVYLISQTPHAANATPDGPPQYRRHNVLTIYP